MTVPDRPDPAAFLQSVTRELRRETRQLVPWFLTNMPEYYFRTHAAGEQARHVRAIISGQTLSGGQSATLWNPERTRVTRIAPAAPRTLVEHLAEFSEINIRTSRLYASLDGRLRLDTFLLEPQPSAGEGGRALARAAALMEAGRHLDPRHGKAFRAFLRGAPADYVDKFDPVRAARHFALYRELAGRDEVRVELHLLPGETESRLVVAMFEPPASGLLLRVAEWTLAEGLDIPRGYSDRFVFADGDFTVISLYVRRQGLGLVPPDPVWDRLKARLRRVKWTAPHALDALARDHAFDPEEVEVLAAGCECAHQLLARRDLHAFTSENVVRAVLGHPQAARACLEYFVARFAPDGAGRGAGGGAALDAAARLAATVGDEVARNVFETLLAVFRHTLRTNYCLPGRFGLAFRLDPAILAFAPGLDAGPEEERPYGLFFLHGPHVQGFHLRYRDMARGGVRLVRTRSREQFELESNRLLAEVRNLALSQQYKNKDIPEGGAKAVLLLGPGADVTLALKCAVDGLLDCLVPGPNGTAPGGGTDYLGRDECLYLGPDEGISPRHIAWIAARARERGYRWPEAFMSSKGATGINHKRYGVTSLGVLEFADVFLREAGIDPDLRPFTVKITGGPAGDVAGNAMRQLIARYGDRARIVAVGDGHGAAYDPEGLNHVELVRLVDAQRGIAEFAPASLSGEGAFVVRADTPEGAKTRSGLHNAVAADLFIPAGGRPDAIHGGNWREFCDADGRPSARVVVEGANLFLTAEARLRLEEAGVWIVPGPSANKAGVICSSYEILAGMAMTEAEFAASKRRYVAEVLDILRRTCRAEAALLLREHRRSGGRLGIVGLSGAVSREITELKDAIAAALAASGLKVADDPLLRRLAAAHCPPLLAARHFDRLLENAPESYLQAMVAAHAASTIVYAEGLGWLPRLAGLSDVLAVLRTYYRQADVVAGHMAAVGKSRLSGRGAIGRILSRAGCRLLCEDALFRDGGAARDAGTREGMDSGEGGDTRGGR